MCFPVRAAVPCGLLALLLVALPATAQEIRGTVTDEADGVPIATVEVFLEDDGGERRGQAVTDSLGGFQIRAPLPGHYTLTLSRIGYATRSTAPFELARGEVVTLDISLDAAALHLEPLVVVERRRVRTAALARFYDRAEWVRKSGSGRIYYREDLERVGSVHGLYQMQSTRRSCRMLILVDNLPVSDPRDLEYLADMDRVEGVEIYRSQHQIPPEYSSWRACSMMLVWTRPTEGRPFTLKRLLVGLGAVAAFILIVRP